MDKTLTYMYTYMCMYIKSTMVKVVSLEITAALKLRALYLISWELVGESDHQIILICLNMGAILINLY